jgi:hypothetical protein
MRADFGMKLFTGTSHPQLAEGIACFYYPANVPAD